MKMLGEYYSPSGLALETAQAVLECKFPQAVNVAIGCSNGCDYCYGPLACKKAREEWLQVRLPQKSPKELVQLQWQKFTDKNPLAMLGEQNYFVSFFTDPFLNVNRKNTEDLLDYLLFKSHTKVATLSKLGISEKGCGDSLRSGISIVSIDEQFRRLHEPNTASYKERLKMLCLAHERGYSWASLEPYPCSEIWKQPIEPLLEELKFWGIDFIIFGKWNYDKRASTEQARQEYADNVNILTDFCKSNKIRLHVKSDTLDFIKKPALSLSLTQHQSNENKPITEGQ